MSCLEIRHYTNKTFSDKFISVLMLGILRLGHVIYLNNCVENIMNRALISLSIITQENCPRIMTPKWPQIQKDGYQCVNVLTTGEERRVKRRIRLERGPREQLQELHLNCKLLLSNWGHSEHRLVFSEIASGSCVRIFKNIFLSMRSTVRYLWCFVIFCCKGKSDTSGLIVL